jgi:ferredoxin
MTFIIVEPCIGTCDTACVDVCPVDCIHGPFDKTGAGAEVHEDGFNPEGLQLYIDPEECIDCAACEPECPVEAIYADDEVPEEWDEYIKKNYEYFGQEAP